MPVSSKEFLDIQATMECAFTLKHVRDMIRTYSQIAFYITFIFKNFLKKSNNLIPTSVVAFLQEQLYSLLNSSQEILGI